MSKNKTENKVILLSEITTDKFFCFLLAYVLLNSDLPVRRTGLPVILNSIEESTLTLIKVLSLTPGLQRVQRTKKQVNRQGVGIGRV